MTQNLGRFKVFALLPLLFLSLGGKAWAAAPPQALHLKIEGDRLLKEGQIERAISFYRRVLREERDFANAYYNLATAYYLKGELGKAAENLESFLRFEPKDSEALYNLGCLKIRLGRFNEAMRCFLKARNSPSSRLISQKIKEALHFTKDLSRENPETQKLLATLLTGSA